MESATQPNAAEQVTTETQPEPTPSIASLMAKSGTKVEAGDLNSSLPNKNNHTTKSENTETPLESKKVEQVDPTTTTSDKDAALESQTPKKGEPQKAQPEIQATEKVEPPTWQEVLKSQQPESVLRELGFDDDTLEILGDLNSYEQKKYFANFLKAAKEGRQTAYLKEWATDYSKMSSEEVMRHQLRNEYPKANEKQIDLLFKKEYVERYNLDSEDEEEKEQGRLLLDAKADNYRDKMIESQKSYLMPTPVATEDLSLKEEQLEEARQQQKLEEYKSEIENNPYSKGVLSSSEVVIGEGQDALKIKVDPETIRGLLYDSNKFAETNFDIKRDKDGNIVSAVPKVENQILIAAFSQDPKKFIKDLAEHYKAIGAKKVVEPMDNAKPLKAETITNGQQSYKSAAEAMAKAGVKIAGGV